MKVTFKVEDTGIGIQDERLRNIFNLFEKEDNQHIDEYLDVKDRTARIGLPLSQSLCKLMGSRIKVLSELNKGSKFQFSLPLNSNVSGSGILEIMDTF